MAQAVQLTMIDCIKNCLKPVFSEICRRPILSKVPIYCGLVLDKLINCLFAKQWRAKVDIINSHMEQCSKGKIDWLNYCTKSNILTMTSTVKERYIAL